ncbi:MAG TPA: hypothetical protein PK186_12410 [candidate division Zixibacteria bacterium]|nr:hypothetical protein [candidate division Zixibacteria bacterium]MDD4918315.1 hypothetical protein [candidate division Zixibacteria bacterium]MDM7974021.1 hypothetical protein [candidate division Zixibacteria bacterium]HOD67292.1 hypothetical protein [candidate division Zixibacteria bacterium]HPM38350.1 hypothetical protein [candidate division Zixibacteria bacterium]
MRRWYIGHEQKRRYQGSFLLACLATYAIVIGGSLFLLSGSGVERPAPAAGAAAAGAPTASAERPAAAGTRLPRPMSGGGAPGGKFRLGFVGAVRIVRDVEWPRISVPKRGREDPPAAPMLAQLDFPATTGGGRGDSYGLGDDPFGLAPSEPYLPATRRAPQWGMEQLPRGETRDAAVEFWAPSWPPGARLGRERRDTAIVYVWLLIRPDGTVRYRILSETPAGQGFGREVESALLRSRYTPPVREGVKDSVAFVLRVLLCEGCDSYMTEEPPNIRASMRQPRR